MERLEDASLRVATKTKPRAEINSGQARQPVKLNTIMKTYEAEVKVT